MTIVGWILAFFLIGNPGGWIDLAYVPMHNEPIIPQIGRVEKYRLDYGLEFERGRTKFRLGEVIRYGGVWSMEDWSQSVQMFTIEKVKTTRERHYELELDLGDNWLLISEHKDPTEGATWNIATDYYWRIHLRKEF